MEVLHAAIKVTKEFNTELEGDDKLTLIVKTEISFKDILHWLYLVSKGKINLTPTIGSPVCKVRNHFSNLDRMIGMTKSESSQKANIDLLKR